MTHFQSIMLASCFGFLIGTLISDVIIIVKCAIESHRDKKRKKAEEAEGKQ